MTGPVNDADRAFAAAPPPSPAGEAPAAGARRRSPFVLAARLASGLVAVALCYAGLWWDARLGTGWFLALLVSLVALAGLHEFLRFVGHLAPKGCPLDIRPFAGLAYAAAALLPWATEWDCLRHAAGASLPMDFSTGLIALTALGSCLWQLTRRTPDGAMANVGLTLLAVAYCAWLPSFFVRMRHLAFPDPGAAHGYGWEYQGVEFVVMGIFMAKNTDCGALLIGGRWGRTKLIPRLSPGKTREGALGGLAFSVGLMAICLASAPNMALSVLGWPLALGLAVLTGLASIAGDLVESAFKRDCRLKDAGSGVPGFGGMLDLVDSLMVAGPVMYGFLLLAGACAR